MASCTVKSVQSTVRSAFIIISICTLVLHAVIIGIEIKNPKVDPDNPRRVNFLCFPQENENVLAGFMEVLRITDIVLLVCSLVVCSIAGCFPSLYKLHWALSMIAILRFGIVVGDVLNVSNLNGDTQLDIILSVHDGSCKISGHQLSAFQAVYSIFVLRCVKWFLTISIGSVAYANSMLFFFFGVGIDVMDLEPEEHELEEMGDRVSVCSHDEEDERL